MVLEAERFITLLLGRTLDAFGHRDSGRSTVMRCDSTTQLWAGSKLFAVSLILLVIGGCVGCSSSGSTNSESVKSGSGNKQQVLDRIRKQEQLQSQAMEFCEKAPRVVPKGKASPSLALNRSIARAGGRRFVRIENRGEESLSYGPAPHVDQLLGSKWHPRRFANGVAFPAISLELPPESWSPCVEVPVSRSWPSGIIGFGWKQKNSMKMNL